MTNRLSALIVAALTSGALSACSLALDPDNCSSNAECAPGTCQSGICVGPVGQGGQGGDGGTGGTGGDGGTGGEDAGPDADAIIDMGPVGGQGGVGGTGGQPPDPVAPRCTIVQPLPEARLVGEPEVTFEFKIEDTDTDLAQITAEFGPANNRTALTLDAEGHATVQRTVDEGVSVFGLRAVDADGLSCTASVTINADFTGPSLALTVPAAARTETNDAPFTLEGTTDDANPARHLEVTVGGAMVPVEPTWLDRGRSFTAPVDLQPGSNAVRLVAFDAAGNASEPIDLTLVLDQEAPVVAIDAPLDGTVLYQPSVDISGTVLQADSSPEINTALQITVTGPQPGQRNRVQNVRTDAAGHFAVDGRDAYLGANQVEVCAEDPAGNEHCQQVTIQREIALPCIDIDAPIDGAVLGGEAVEVTGTVCPVVASVALMLGNGAPVDAEIADGRFSGTIILPGPGQHRIDAQATAPDGSTADDAVNVVLDNTPPEIRITRPERLDCVNALAVEVCGTATDRQSGITRIEVNGVPGGGVAGGVFCITVPLDEGFDRPLVAIATNGAGLTTRTDVIVDADAAAPELSFDNQNGAWTGVNDVNRVLISGHIDVGFCGVPGVFVTIGGVRVGAGLEPDGSWRHAREAPDGTLEVVVDATDRAGRRVEAAIEIQVDSTPPTIGAIRPVEPRLLSVGFTEVSAQVNDGPGSGIVAASINGEDVQISGGRIRRQIPVPEGASEVIFEVRDLVGNINTTTILIYRDVTGPVVTITSPDADTNVPTPLLVTGTVDDGENGSGVERVEVNGQVAQVAADGTWRAFDVPIDPVDPRVTATAVDNEGNVTAVPAVLDVQVLDFALLDPGTFGTGGASDIGQLVLADINGNNRIDIVALSQTDTPSRIYQQQLDGTFVGLAADISGLAPLGPVWGAEAGDFNNDGRVDLLAWGADFVHLWMGDGQGTFVGPNDNLSDASGHTDVVVGDFSRDGTLDVLLMAGAQSRVYYGRAGNDVFIPDAPILVGLGAAADMTHGAFIDLNADGLPDLVASGPTGMRIWSGNAGEQRFVEGQQFDGAGHVAEHLVAFDANRDGDLDLLTASGDAGRIYAGDRTDGLALPSAGPWAAGDRAVTVIDLDGDARDDLVFATGSGLRAMRAEADGSFSAYDLAALGVPALGVLDAVQAADIDDDGDIDLVAAGPTGLFVLRSNMNVTHADTWHTVRVDVRRSLPFEDGPRDGLGTVIYQNLSGGPAPERAVVAHPTTATVITIPMPDDQTELEVRYPDRGARGAFLNPLGLIRSGRRVVSYDPAP